MSESVALTSGIQAELNAEDYEQPNQRKKRKLSVESEEVEEITQIRKRLFYEDSGSKFEFEDGKTINFDKKLLCWRSRSPAIDKLCFGDLKEDNVKITDFDYKTFQLFLNCVMGFSELTTDNAVEIFPIVCKYLMTKWIEKCAAVLKPVEMNEDICNLLNMAFFYNQPKLLSVIKEYVQEEGSAYGLLENNWFSDLLSLESFLEIIEWVEIDSYILNVIICWCDNYLKLKNSSENIKEFLIKLELIERFKIDLFESGTLLHKFIESDLGKDMFAPSEVSKYFIDRQCSAQKKCKWVIRKDGQSLSEEYDISDLQLQNFNFLSFKFGKIVKYVSPDLKISCTLRQCNPNQTGNSGSNIPGIWNINNQSFDFSLSSWNLTNRYGYGGSSSLRFKIKYYFQQDCRVLVKNIKPRVNNNETTPFYTDKFYFTHEIFPVRT